MADDNNANTGGDDANKAEDTGRAGGDAKVLEELHDERKARQAAETALKERDEKLAKFEAANKTEHEKALDEARQQARNEAVAEVTTQANARILRTEVRRLAAEKFADASDPLGALDLAQFSVDDNGNVDEKAINRELDDLLKKKPHWGKTDTTKRSHGSADQGARGTGASAPSMNDLIRKDRFGS